MLYNIISLSKSWWYLRGDWYGEKIREIIENKLNGEQYNVDEIFGLIKDNGNGNVEENNSWDGRDELIIAPPHIYYQFNSW